MSAFLSTAIAVPAAYAATPEVSLEFTPDSLQLRSTVGNFFYSFDGVNDHGMARATDTTPLQLRTKNRKVWFKQDGGAATARVSALTDS